MGTGAQSLFLWTPDGRTSVPWAAIMDISGKDADGNAVRGDAYIHETRNSLVHGQHRLVSVVGLEGVIVVETADAVLVADKNRRG